MPAPLNLRDRVLTAREVKIVWDALEQEPVMSGDVKRALQLILVTAQRPGEVTGMHTREVEGEWWTIPGERAKNGKPHRVPLSFLAREIITVALEQNRRTREEKEDHAGYIFPSPHRAKEKPIERHALSKALKRNESEDGTVFGIRGFTPHDLRRTAATFMAESGEMDEVIDAVLSHAKQGIIKVYNQFKYDSQKKAALETWARRLTDIIHSTE